MQSSPNSNNIQQHFANDSKNNEDSATNEPDSDTIKMFVGQIPKVKNKLIFPSKLI